MESSDKKRDSKAKVDHIPLPQVLISSEHSIHRDGAVGQEIRNEETTSSLKNISNNDLPEKLVDIQRNNTEVEEPIFILAWDCDELIDKCLQQAQEDSSAAQTVLEQHRRSFNAWSKYLGVFAEKKTNLDRRLLRKAGIRDIVIRLLLILKQNLTQLSGSSAISSAGVPTQSMPSESSNSATIKILNDHSSMDDSFISTEYFFEAISEALEELSHVGVAIRKSSRTTETARARKYVSERPEMIMFEILCSVALNTLHQNAPQSILQQLCESMVSRYARHLFRAPRQQVLEQDIRRPPVIPEKPEVNNLRPESAGTLPVLVPEQSSHHDQVERRDEVLPTIPLTSANSSRFDHHLRLPRTTKSRAGTTVVLGKIHEPPIPSFNDSGQARCEWCFRLIDRNLVEDGHWSSLGRDHYRKDLEPFPCIWQRCSEGAPGFSSIRDWNGHMLKHYPTWTQRVHAQPMWKCTLEVSNLETCHYGHAYECSACTSQYTHETAAYFTSADDFLGHVRTVHARHTKTWDDNDLSVLADDSLVQTILEPNLCPICYLTPQGLELSGPKSMHNHVAEHLQLLMLLSLRLLKYPDGHPDDKEDTRSISAAGAEENLSGTNEKDSNEGSNADDPLSPFGSPVIRPQSAIHSDGEAVAEGKQVSWSDITDQIREKKHAQLEEEFDQVLDRFKNATLADSILRSLVASTF